MGIISVMWPIFTHNAMLAQYRPLSCVCSSVCLSVTRRYCIKTVKHRIMQATLHDSPGNLVFWCQRSRLNSNRVTANGAAKCSCDFWHITRYNSKMLQERCVVSISQIGSHVRSIEWWHADALVMYNVMCMDGCNCNQTVITSADRRRLCFRCGLFVCLFVCLSVGLLANLWTDFDEILWRGRAWLRDQVIQFWWRSGSRFGSGSPKSEIRIIRIGGGLFSVSAFLLVYGIITE